MNHAVHVHDGRAAPRTFAGRFPGGAARRRAAVRGFASGSLLARHVSRFQISVSLVKPDWRANSSQNDKKKTLPMRKRSKKKKGMKSCSSSSSEEEVQFCRFAELRVGRMFVSELSGCFLLLRSCSQDRELAAARTAGRCDVAPNSTLSDNQSRYRDAFLQQKPQPFVSINNPL